MTYRTELANFISAIPTFPNSSTGSNLQYNTGKLIKILQKKEVFEVCNIDDFQFEEVNRIDIELGTIVSDILKEVNLEQSLIQYLEIEKKIENSFSDNLYLYAKQGALSVKSLYYYKTKDFPKAMTFTLECTVLNDYLVQQGVYTLNLRCFEQNKNISRIYFRDHKDEDGYKLIFNLLNYLFNGNSTKLFGNIFNHKEYWLKLPIIRETYAYELFMMITEDIIKFNINNTEEYLPDYWYADLDFEVNTPERQIIYNWIYINKQRKNLNYKEYFDCLIYYFQQPINQFYDILKISLLIDLHKMVKKNPNVDIKIFNKKIVDFMKNKLSSHISLQKLLIKNIFQ